VNIWANLSSKQTSLTMKWSVNTCPLMMLHGKESLVSTLRLTMTASRLYRKNSDNIGRQSVKLAM